MPDMFFGTFLASLRRVIPACGASFPPFSESSQPIFDNLEVSNTRLHSLFTNR